MFANFIAYAVMGIPAGMMLKQASATRRRRLRPWPSVSSAWASSIFRARSRAASPIYLIGAFVSGFSMCMLNTVVNPMLNTLGGGGKRGNQLIQFGGSLNSISATIVPVLVGYLMGNAANCHDQQGELRRFSLRSASSHVAFIVLYFMQHSRTGTGDRSAKRVCGRC